MNENKTPRAAALLPIAVFLVLYLGLGIVLEYVLKVKMGFYQIPIVVAFLVAILVACLQNRSISFDEKLALMGQGIGDKNIVTMILIFLAAGVFVGVTGRSSAEAVAYFLPASVRGLRYGRQHVRRQPVLYFRHHHRRLLHPGLPNEG